MKQENLPTAVLDNLIAKTYACSITRYVFMPSCYKYDVCNIFAPLFTKASFHSTRKIALTVVI